VGGVFRNTEALAAGAHLISQAGNNGVSATRIFRAGSNPKAAVSGGRIDPLPWRESQEPLALAAANVQRALERVKAEPAPLMPALAGARAEFIREGELALSSLRKAEASLDLVPQLFGVDSPKRWLVVIQNPVELRATGGFLGAFGIMRAEGGRLQLDRMESNLGLPVLRAPPPGPEDYVDRYDRFSARTMWQNVNMTPDFPTAAEMMTGMWKSATGEQLDGVIAIDAQGLAKLLRVVGPVDDPELGTIDAERFVPLALNEAYVRYPDKIQRVDVLLRVGRHVWTKLLTSEFADPRTFAGPMSAAVGRRNIQLWIPGQEELVRRLGVDGGINHSRGSDYLMVVGQNAAANKVDYYASRRVEYKVQIDPSGSFKGEVSVRVDNQTPAEGLPSSIVGPYLPTDRPGLNRTYLSIFASPGTGVDGAWLDGKAVGVESERERELPVFSRFIEALPQSSTSLRTELVGKTAKPGIYRLRVQRQPSLKADRFRLEISAPEGAVITEVSEGLRISGGKAVWSGRLVRDLSFSVNYGSSIRDRLTSLFLG
jgi:hypothetical protein